MEFNQPNDFFICNDEQQPLKHWLSNNNSSIQTNNGNTCSSHVQQHHWERVVAYTGVVTGARELRS